MNWKQTGITCIGIIVVLFAGFGPWAQTAQKPNPLPADHAPGTPLPPAAEEEPLFRNELQKLEQEMQKLRQEMNRMFEEHSEMDIFEDLGRLFRIPQSPQQNEPGWKVLPGPDDRFPGKFYRQMDGMLRQFEEQASGNVAFKNSLQLQETPSHYVVTFKAGDIPREQIEVQLEDRLLTVTARQEHRQESSRSEEAVESTIIRSFSGHFEQSMELPGPVDASRMQTDYKNGMLMILLAKEEGS